MILAPRRHDRQLWANLLKNCDIEHPLSMSDIEQATSIVGAGQIDVVFVDESYGPHDIANILIPARQVEFSGGRGVCLILCSKKATAQDVLNARKLGFASLVILPASIDTVRKHLELAARYIPLSDEELGWSKPKVKALQEERAEAKRKLAQSAAGQNGNSTANPSEQARATPSRSAPTTIAGDINAPDPSTDRSDERGQPRATNNPSSAGTGVAAASARDGAAGHSPSSAGIPSEPGSFESQKAKGSDSPLLLPRSSRSSNMDEDMPSLIAPGRSGRSAEEDVVFV
nr:hypothetical protein [uncultured Cohaesibacter sp.]